MTPFQKSFTKAYAKELIAVATGDLRTAKVLIDHPEGRPENTFFLLQQTIEKALKAVLCHYERPVPLTHDLGALLGVLPQELTLPNEQKSILALTEFASIRRYEEGKYRYTSQEAAAAYDAAAGVLKWAKSIVE